MSDLNKQSYLLAFCLAGLFSASASYAGLPDSLLASR
ncbi:fimbrial protein, partial [Providencia rettgeri]